MQFGQPGQHSALDVHIRFRGRSQLLQRLADFIAGIVFEFFADLVLFVGGIGYDVLVAVDDQEIPNGCGDAGAP
ncbi:hypothetical protein ACWGTI_19885 [Mesorhizobium sp. ArgA1]